LVRIRGGELANSCSHGAEKRGVKGLPHRNRGRLWRRTSGGGKSNPTTNFSRVDPRYAEEKGKSEMNIDEIGWAKPTERPGKGNGWGKERNLPFGLSSIGVK